MTTKDLEFNKNKHEYRFKKKHIPSVTQILSPISNQLYRNIEHHILNNKASIGTEVHKLIEQHSKWGIIQESDHERVNSYFKSYLMWNNELENNAIFENEFKGIYTSDKMTFAGTIDNIRMIDNDVYLIDYKTTATPNATILALQLYGYKLIAEQTLGIVINKFMGLCLMPNEKPIVYDLTNMVNDKDTKEFFETLYKLNQYFDLYGIKEL